MRYCAIKYNVKHQALGTLVSKFHLPTPIAWKPSDFFRGPIVGLQDTLWICFARGIWIVQNKSLSTGASREAPVDN